MRPEELRQKVDDLEAALEAIRGGGVDAVIVGPEDHKRVYTLTSADRPYRVIVEEMGEGAATISESTAVLFVNRRLAALLGRDRAELVGTSALGLVGDGDAASLAELLTVVPGQTARCELALCRSDGSSLPALVSVTGLDIEGVVIRCLVATDLTARRQAEQQLAQANRDLEQRALELERANRQLARTSSQFSAAFEHAPVGMALASFDRTVLRANEALSALVGVPADRLVGRSVDALIDGVAVDEPLFAELVAGTRDHYRCELRLHPPEGESLWVTFSVARVHDPDGEDYAAFHIEDITDRKGYEHRLQHFADHDPLTGLLNRRRFREELDRFLEVGIGRRGGGALVLLDLDGFKYVNDTLGHPAGDSLLQAVTVAMRGCLRSSDLLARLGGDEFAVLLYGAGREQSPALVGDLLEAVRQEGSGISGQRLRTTASAGIVVLDGTAGTTADEVLANADLAMYAAKERGRDCLVVYDAEIPSVARSQASFLWIDRIRQALEQDLFALVAQPIYDLAASRITGCELLLRLRRGKQLIGPDEFLPVADRHGLSGAIDVQVVRKAMALAGRWGRGRDFRWEINLSGAALVDPSFPDMVEAELAQHRVAPQSVVFEITETTAITNMAEAQAFAQRITALGCGFALDDFGAGYGGFYYLKFLPLDYLKIDGEFIRGLAVDRTNQVIVQGIVSVARPLGKETIAEYVGDSETLELLRGYGVDHAQGYVIGRPRAPERLFARLPGPRASSRA